MPQQTVKDWQQQLNEDRIIPLLKVTKNSTDGKITTGDWVWYSPLDGALNIAGGEGGRFAQEELTPQTTDFECIRHPLYVVLIHHGSEQIVAKSVFTNMEENMENETFAKIKVVNIDETTANAVKESFGDDLKPRALVEFGMITANGNQTQNDLKGLLFGEDIVFIVTTDKTADIDLATMVAESTKEVCSLTFGLVIQSSLVGLGEWEKAMTAENEKFQAAVDALLVMPPEDIYQLITSITELFASPDGVINFDFADIREFFSHCGYAAMGFGTASGENAYQAAFQKALNAAALKDDLKTAGKVLLSISGAKERCSLGDAHEAIENILMKLTHPWAEIIWGLSEDERLNDSLKVTVIATDIGKLKPEED
ncbi:MAG: hypothetical protein IJ849_03740 [Selenomonadaceae bacterium]|nr:hypothetical protein [Selenomonadaceae bacterium]